MEWKPEVLKEKRNDQTMLLVDDFNLAVKAVALGTAKNTPMLDLKGCIIKTNLAGMKLTFQATDLHSTVEVSTKCQGFISPTFLPAFESLTKNITSFEKHTDLRISTNPDNDQFSEIHFNNKGFILTQKARDINEYPITKPNEDLKNHCVVKADDLQDLLENVNPMTLQTDCSNIGSESIRIDILEKSIVAYGFDGNRLIKAKLNTVENENTGTYYIRNKEVSKILKLIDLLKPETVKLSACHAQIMFEFNRSILDCIFFTMNDTKSKDRLEDLTDYIEQIPVDDKFYVIKDDVRDVQKQLKKLMNIAKSAGLYRSYWSIENDVLTVKAMDRQNTAKINLKLEKDYGCGGYCGLSLKFIMDFLENMCCSQFRLSIVDTDTPAFLTWETDKMEVVYLVSTMSIFE